MRKESFVTPKYWNDNRTPSEKLLTKQMILKISEENISRKKLSFSGKLLT